MNGPHVIDGAGVEFACMAPGRARHGLRCCDTHCLTTGRERIRGEASRGVHVIDAVGRLFLCARCREQVVLCSRCDRGQRYCGQACSDAVRRDRQRAAGQRYQCSSAGRAKHAERSRRWRLSQRERQREPTVDASAPVTHHGPPEPVGDVPGPVATAERSPASVGREAPAQWRCPGCTTLLLPWVRQGFMRRRRTVVGCLARAGPHSAAATDF